MHESGIRNGVMPENHYAAVFSAAIYVSVVTFGWELCEKLLWKLVRCWYRPHCNYLFRLI